MDVELQILKNLPTDAHPTVGLVDEYCAGYQAIQFSDFFKIASLLLSLEY
jgi:hypothetical protein